MEEKKVEKIDSSNIFDELTSDSNLIEEVNNIKKERDKDIFFYVSKIGSIIQVFFWIILLLVIIAFLYITIQKNTDLKNSNILDPFCYVILGDVINTDSYCSSIASLKKEYLDDLKNIQELQVKTIIDILPQLYEKENFLESKDVLFLLDKTDNKLKALEILENFDDLKNSFSDDKQRIQCNSIIIDDKKDLLSMKCTAYSAGFEKGLRGYDGTNNKQLKGSSISIANSFINYLEKNDNGVDTFRVIDRQKVFKSDVSLDNNTGFTNSTSFSLKLVYNLK